MEISSYQFQVQYEYTLRYTRDVFSLNNETLIHSLPKDASVVTFVDEGVLNEREGFLNKIESYYKAHSLVSLSRPLCLMGGETVKNNEGAFRKVLQYLDQSGADRHSFVIAIGGGAFLDTVGFAASSYHRGIPILRLPTTVLAQNDAGIGVKNGINFFGQKNFLGHFAPPYAVINDSSFLKTLDSRDQRSGMAEALKISLIKSPTFFKWIEEKQNLLRDFDIESVEYLIKNCADLHIKHITCGGDPFEKGNARPLDFGHWSAHKLEKLSHYEIKHGEAVAMGMALDCVYSWKKGSLDLPVLNRVLSLIKNLGFEVYHPLLETIEDDGSLKILKGLEEFRIHLGGSLKIPLLKNIGDIEEVSDYKTSRLYDALMFLREWSCE